jgi:DNA-directed RNA polymerase specialized sigma24 family protein
VCHLGWITPLIRSVAREKGAKKTRLWLLHDASRVIQRVLADRLDVSTSTVSEWISDVRLEVEDQLKDRGYLSV